MRLLFLCLLNENRRDAEKDEGFEEEVLRGECYRRRRDKARAVRLKPICPDDVGRPTCVGTELIVLQAKTWVIVGRA